MPIEFTHIEHVAMGIEDAERQAEIFEGLFGFQRVDAWETDSERGILFAFGNSEVRWGVVQPTSDGSALSAFLESPRGPGIHHVTFAVDDLHAARQELQALGVRPSTRSTDRELIVSSSGAGEGVEIRFALAKPRREEPTRASAGGQSLGIVTLDHVCTAYPDRDTLSHHYGRLLGARQVWRTPDGAWPDFGDCILELPGQQMHWEVIQPVGEESFITTFLERRGPSVHHVAFEVADFDAAKRACEFHEVPTFDEHDDSTDGARWRDLFIHPKFTGGLLTQLFWEEQPGVWERSDKVRPEGFAG